MDLKDAYLKIPIHQESQNLLQLQWELITSSVSHLDWLQCPGLLKGDEACDGNPQVHIWEFF